MANKHPESKVLDKGLFGLSLPIIFEQFVVFSLPMADSFFLSRVSDNAAAAAGALMPVLILAAMVLNMLSVGGGCIAGQYIGADRYERGNAALLILATVTGLVALVETGLLFWGRGLLVSALGLPEEVAPMAMAYLSVIAFLMPALGGRRVYTTIINTYGHPKWNLISSVLMCLINIGLNAWVVYGLHGGVKGVALASVSAAVITLGIRVAWVHGILKLKLPFRYAWTHFKTLYNEIWAISLPCIVEPLSFHLSMVVLSGLTARLGAVPLAAKTYAYNIFQLGVVVSISLGMANQSIVSQLIGKLDFDKAARQFKQSLRVGVVGSGVMVLVLLIFNQQMMALFTDAPEILKLAFLLFAFSAITEIPRAINIITGGTLRACGDAWFTTRISIPITWVISIPLTWFFAFKLEWGIAGVMAGSLIDETLRSVMNLLRWQTGVWRNKRIIS